MQGLHARMLLQGLGSRVWGLGCRVWGLGFRELCPATNRNGSARRCPRVQGLGMGEFRSKTFVIGLSMVLPKAP